MEVVGNDRVHTYVIHVPNSVRFGSFCFNDKNLQNHPNGFCSSLKHDTLLLHSLIMFTGMGQLKVFFFLIIIYLKSRGENLYLRVGLGSYLILY